MKFHKIKYFTSSVLLSVFMSVSAQTLPTVPVPQAVNPNKNFQSSFPYGNQRTNPHNPNELSDIQRRNYEMIMRDVEENQRQIDAEIQRQSVIKMLLEKGFASQSEIHDTSCYQNAFNEINQMLKGEIPMNLARAVFLVENAYYGDSLKYSDYENFIKNKVALCKSKIQEEKLNPNDNLVKNITIYRLLTDTLKIKTGGKIINSYPISYDYYDYRSEENYDSHFVTKLMRSGIGQCYSMPLYYLILAEAMNSEAFWAFSPRHSFVKIQDDNGDWYNLELTCRAILSDAHYMNNSYIKSEAIRNRIYLEPLDKKNSIAQMLISLARGYYVKYGMDDFYLKCADTAMEYLSNDLDALMLKSEYETRLIRALGYLYGAENTDILLERCPESAKHFEKREMLYKQIDDLGYEDLPAELYARWLEHIAKEKAKSEKEKSIFLRPSLKRH